MRARILALLAKWSRALQTKSSEEALIRHLTEALNDSKSREYAMRADYMERSAELIEAKQMCGAGPWLVHESRASVDEPGKLRESNPITSQGAFGDIELALQNIEWRREVNLSWLEFSRWGIQQIILICRLYYIKNPIIRRLIDVSADYVFARGVEVSSPNDAANRALAQFFADNQKVLGQKALSELEKRKDYDGNLFFAFFPDSASTGRVKVRTMDATEIQDIVTDPDDSDTPWFCRRTWQQRFFDPKTGRTETRTTEAWYPALNHTPDERPEKINGVPVMWDSPVYHSKCGGVAKWLFGCPRIYPAIDWAKASTKYLESCATVNQALSQIAKTISTKGGQQAIEGIKQQLQTSVGPTSQIWDTNPTPVSGSTFVSGPGTTLAAFKTRGAGGDPEEVRQYKLMACMVAGVPETFLADVSTGNLATATSLDRPTETGFLGRQEAWREDLVAMATYILGISNKASGGRLRESAGKVVVIREQRRKRLPDGRMIYDEADRGDGSTVVISCNFPAIREGDIPALVTATTEAMTLGGQTIQGIDAKAGCRKLYDLLGIENGDELVEEQFPDATYEPDRTLEPEPQAASVEEALRRVHDAIQLQESRRAQHA